MSVAVSSVKCLLVNSKLVSRSSRKATVAKTVLIGQAQVLRSHAKPSR